MMQTPVEDGAEQIRLGGTSYVWRNGLLLDVGERTVPLRAKSLRMLEVLLSERGRVVSKDRLSELVWPDVIATDESIARCIADIRKVLGDSSHRIIETFPKQGYRLKVGSFKRSSLTPPHRVSLLLLIAGVVVVLLGTFLWFSDTRSTALETPLAVPAAGFHEGVPILPFSAETEQDRFLAAGLSEELEIQLAEMSGIRIMSQAQSQGMVEVSESPIDLSQSLKVRYFVGGSVRSNGAEISVSLQLIDGSDGTIVWADRFEGPRGNLLAYRQTLPGTLVEAMQSRWLHATSSACRLKRPLIPPPSRTSSMPDASLAPSLTKAA